jgi:spermidine synthase
MTVFQGLALPKVVYETDSPLNGHLMVIDVGKTRKLSVNGTVQSVSYASPASQRQYWGRAIEGYKEFFPQMANIMILGLGGGTFAHLLSQSFSDISIVAVEFDPVMLKVAEDYFDIRQVPNLHVIVGDALKVLASPEAYQIKDGSFDSIFVDIYVGDKYPELGETGTFIAGLKRVVRQGGWVVFNRLYWDYHQDEVNSFIDDLQMYFHEIKSIIVAGKTNSDNVLIFCHNE